MKTYQFGNAVVRVNSPVLSLSKEERVQWYADETAKNNPRLVALEDAVHAMYASHKGRR